jgi:hypothetical protein
MTQQAILLPFSPLIFNIFKCQINAFMQCKLIRHNISTCICTSGYFGLTQRDSGSNVRLTVLVILEFQTEWEEWYGKR